MNSWSNTAQNPSRIKENGTINEVAELLGLPPSCINELNRSLNRDVNDVFMYSEGGWSKGVEFEPNMLMSFKRNGINYVTVVYSEDVSKGSLHPVTCHRQTHFIAYWENCGNLSLLEQRTEHRGGDSLNLPNNPMSVSEPGIIALIFIGLLAMMLLRRLI